VDLKVVRRAFFSAVAAMTVFACQAAARAQEPAAEESADETTLVDGPPVAVVNVAGVERILDDVDYLFGSVQRSDMTKVVTGLLSNVGDLKGLQRGKPLGVMLFLQPGVIPTPVPVGYLPVEDASALAKTVEIGPNVTTKKVAEDRYEIISPRRTIFARMVGEYAFVAADETILDRELPDPTVEFAGLTTRYDVCAKVQPENVPPGMRDLFVTLLRTRAQADLQQRNDEPDAAYAFRKSQGMQNLRAVEAFLKETRSITIGLDTSRENHKAVLEFVIEAVPDTPYLETLQSLAEEPSRFDSLIDDDVPLAISLNSKLDEYSQKTQREMLEVGERQTAVLLTKLERGDSLDAPATQPAAPAEGATASKPLEIEPTPAALDIAARIFGPIKAVNEGGNLDAFVQVRGDLDEKVVALGGVEIPGASGMDSAVREFIERFRAGVPDVSDKVDVQFGAGEAAGVTLHRIAPKEVDEGGKRIFGEGLGLYIGFGPDAMWLAVGGGQAVDVVAEAVTRVNETSPLDRKQPAAPLQLVVTANRWVGLSGNEGAAQLATDAFENGDDTLRIDFRPTEHGGRLRIEAEEGFIRLLGLGVSKRYDESQL